MQLRAWQWTLLVIGVLLLILLVLGFIPQSGLETHPTG